MTQLNDSDRPVSDEDLLLALIGCLAVDDFDAASVSDVAARAVAAVTEQSSGNGDQRVWRRQPLVVISPVGSSDSPQALAGLDESNSTCVS